MCIYYIVDNLSCSFLLYWFGEERNVQIPCFDVVLEDMDISKAITEYTAHAAIENLVLGASRHGFIR